MSDFCYRLPSGGVLYGPTTEAVKKAAAFCVANNITNNAGLNAFIDNATIAQVRAVVKMIFEIRVEP